MRSPPWVGLAFAGLAPAAPDTVFQSYGRHP
jgi:hypothetical protein